MFRACFLSESADARPFLAGATAIRDVGARRRLEKSELAENGGVGSAVHADSGAEVLGKTVQAGEECGAIDVHGIEGVQHGFTGGYGISIRTTASPGKVADTAARLSANDLFTLPMDKNIPCWVVSRSFILLA